MTQRILLLSLGWGSVHLLIRQASGLFLDVFIHQVKKAFTHFRADISLRTLVDIRLFHKKRFLAQYCLHVNFLLVWHALFQLAACSVWHEK
jgi:hypothetical protein